jgi:LacI family gluconate utilization system Gnt-I transcriptional repressor
MQEVAAHAGVSPMTVSRAMRDPAAVSQAMLDRVQAAIHDTGYVANRLAGSLASRRSYVVGLIVPGISNSLYASTAEAIADVLRTRGFHLMIGRSGHDPEAEEEAIGAFLAQRVCGLILHSTLHTARAETLIKAAGVPTVEIGRLTRTPLDMCVSYSGHAAVKAMVMHLGRHGCRRIGFVSLPLRNNERAAERRRGYFAGLKALGFAAEPGWAIEAPPGFAGGADAIVRLIARDPSIDAIFFAADVMAVGALFECQRRGWAVPGRVALASFDNVDLLSQVVPTITTLSIPREEIGRRSAAMLIDRLDGHMSGPAVVDLGFSIVQRESTLRPG